MDARWSAAVEGRRAPIAVAAAIATILVIGAMRGPDTAPVPTALGPLSVAAPVPTVQPAAAECRASADDVVSPGVTPTAIRVASTVTLDGPGASFLADAPVGMRAVVNRVNRAGGICGRRIELTTVNDSWGRDRSLATVGRFLGEEYFALVGMPASEGLPAALERGDIDKAGIPVVGTAGLTEAEFASGWVWPVGSSPSTTMGAIVTHALAHGARRFAVVHDAVHQFGLDGAAALVAHVKQLGGHVMTTLPLDPADEDLTEEAHQFDIVCGRFSTRCDAVVLVLDPATTLAWRRANPAAARGHPDGLVYGGPTLLSDEFADACGRWCDGLVVWTPYRPALPPFDTVPGVAKFVADVRAERSGIDRRNQSLQQGYIGMSVFVQAVQHCSPRLTRWCLRDALNTAPFSSDLVGTLRWRATHRQAHTSANGYVLRASAGAFSWEPLDGPGSRCGTGRAATRHRRGRAGDRGSRRAAWPRRWARAWSPAVSPCAPRRGRAARWPP